MIAWNSVSRPSSPKLSLERINTLSPEPSNIDLDPTEKRSTASICDVLALVTNEVVLSTTVSAP